MTLTEMAVKEIVISPRDNLFRPGRRAIRGMLDKPHSPVTIFQVPYGHDLPSSRSGQRHANCLHERTRPINNKDAHTREAIYDM
jgi:hypothetical protein